jgi:hypothetical protein
LIEVVFRIKVDRGIFKGYFQSMSAIMILTADIDRFSMERFDSRCQTYRGSCPRRDDFKLGVIMSIQRHYAFVVDRIRGGCVWDEIHQKGKD